MSERISPIDTQKILSEYLSLEQEFSEPPITSLQLISQTPQTIDLEALNNVLDRLTGYKEDDLQLILSTLKKLGARDIAATTAFQCYAPGVAILKNRTLDKKAQDVADLTLEAGHHTTRMHMYYTFRLIGISRSSTHDIFHSNPYYNSEQQSQRYVEAKEGNYLLPKNLNREQTEHYINSANFTNESYFNLLDMLKAEVERRMHLMYPTAGWNISKTEKRLSSKTDKICQEVARYLLPIAQKTTFYHTLSELQLLRLFRASQFQNFSSEARYTIARMIEEVQNYDPQFSDELKKPIESNYRYGINEKYLLQNIEEFDNKLQGKQSLLLSDIAGHNEILAFAVRNILGLPSTQLTQNKALEILLDPGRNILIGDVYETGILDPLTQSLRSVSLTFASRISHAADSQRQRHRRTPGATPQLEYLYSGQPDYTTPLVIRENPELKNFYDAALKTIYANVKKAIDLGISKQYALMLLPNAHNVRVIEQGDLFDWLHRWKQRLCFLAQEEIFFVSLEQAQQIFDYLPEAKKAFAAPCAIRKHAGIKPRCPEGDKWCGKSVFNIDLGQYQSERLI